MIKLIIEFWKNFFIELGHVIKNVFSKDKDIRRKQIPNILTLTRGIFAPLTIIPAVISKNIYLAFGLIAICSLTDGIDGWYARKYNAQSEFGALLDAICDKIFVLTLTFPLAFTYPEWTIVILVLEFIISVINSRSKLKGYEPKSSIMGKAKTVVLDGAIALCYLDFLPIVTIPNVVLGISSILTNIMQVLSIIGYIGDSRRNAKNKKLETVS